MKLAHVAACACVCLATQGLAAEKVQRPLEELLRGPALDAFRKGRDLFEAGDVVTGHAKLQEAYELSKNPRLLWNMAACSKSSRHYARAIDELTRYVAEGREHLTAEQIRRAQEVQSTLVSFVAAATVTREPEDAALFIDGEPATRGSGPYYLELGKHELRVEREGFATESRVVDVKATKPITFAFTLARPAEALADPASQPARTASLEPPAPASTAPTVPPPAPPPPLPAPAVEADSTTRAWTFASFAVGGAGILAGSTFGLLAMGAARDLEDECPGRVCAPASQATLDDARMNATLATTGWIVGAIGIAAGTTLLLSQPAGATSLVLSPSGAALRGSF